MVYSLWALMFLVMLIVADAGLVLGVIFAAAILPALPALIAAGATLAAVVIAVLILRRAKA